MMMIRKLEREAMTDSLEGWSGDCLIAPKMIRKRRKLSSDDTVCEYGRSRLKGTDLLPLMLNISRKREYCRAQIPLG
jgi:hypothetical protein